MQLVTQAEYLPQIQCETAIFGISNFSEEALGHHIWFDVKIIQEHGFGVSLKMNVK